MKVANKTIYDAVKYNLANISEQLNKANMVVATGKRIIELSDEPVSLTQALEIRSTISNIEQLGRNIELGKSWLTASESALNQVQTLISDAKALSVQMATATAGRAERISAAETVHNMLEELLSLGNTDVDGLYIFSGSKTETTPFSQGGTYNGNNNAFSIKIGRDSTVAIGNDGAAVFGTLFTTFSDLENALRGNDVSGIQAAMGQLDNHLDSISNKISEIGSRMIRMQTKEQIYQDMNITSTDRLSKIEDADIAEAILELKSIEFAYQAALASSARVINLSLLDYL